MKKQAKAAWFEHRPAELMNELMALRDSDAVYFIIQIRNLVLQQGGPVLPDYNHIGRLCGKGEKVAQRVIHRLMALPAADIYETTDGRISSRKADDLLFEFKNNREEAQNHQKESVKSRATNKTNQELRNWLLKFNYLPIPYRTVPLSVSNIKPIPIVNSAAREGLGGGAGMRTAGAVLGGLLQAARTVHLAIDELDETHLREMMERFPDKDRNEVLRCFNAWMQGEVGRGMVVRDKRRVFMGWMKRTRFLPQHVAGNA